MSQRIRINQLALQNREPLVEFGRRIPEFDGAIKCCLMTGDRDRD